MPTVLKSVTSQWMRRPYPLLEAREEWEHDLLDEVVGHGNDEALIEEHAEVAVARLCRVVYDLSCTTT